jgi:hypothetical protein
VTPGGRGPETGCAEGAAEATMEANVNPSAHT